VRAYLSDIGREPLLTREDEQRLGRAMQSGRQASEELARLDGALPSERRRCLQSLVTECERSTRRFIAANLRLVVSIAKRYRASGLTLLDLVQEGNIGLIRAVHKFDPSKGFRFSTYAAFWIRQAIGRAVERAQRLGRAPGQVGGAPLSLSAPVGDEGGELSDGVADDRAARQLDDAITALSPPAVDRLLACLDDREREIIRLRFGLAGDRPLILAEVGARLGLSGERVRQIELRALRRLRPVLAAMEPDDAGPAAHRSR